MCLCAYQKPILIQGFCVCGFHQSVVFIQGFELFVLLYLKHDWILMVMFLI